MNYSVTSENDNESEKSWNSDDLSIDLSKESVVKNSEKKEEEE